MALYLADIFEEFEKEQEREKHQSPALRGFSEAMSAPGPMNPYGTLWSGMPSMGNLSPGDLSFGPGMASGGVAPAAATLHPGVSTGNDDLKQLAYQTAVQHGVPPGLFMGLIEQESRWNPNAVSPAGAIGLGQLMPDTAADLGVDPRDVNANLQGAARYLKQQLDRFGSPEIALAAYNAGPSAVQKYGGIPPYRETQNYVPRVMGYSQGFASYGQPQPRQTSETLHMGTASAEDADLWSPAAMDTAKWAEDYVEDAKRRSTGIPGLYNIGG